MARNVSIQHIRGVAANIPALNAGEFYYATDTQKLFIGTASGNQAIGPNFANAATASQTINAATTAALAGSTIAIPTSKLKVGSSFSWDLTITKTNAGTASNSFNIRCGTTGGTSDTSLVALALPVGTAATDTAQVRITLTCRGPLSASGIFSGSLSLVHNLSATGFATIPCVVLTGLSGSFDVTQANLIVSLSCTTAASTVLTFVQVSGVAQGL
jgi:Major tropism determinant N-terminal domain